MALTESMMLKLGTAAPDFSLLDTVSGEQLALPQVQGESGTLVYFICNHCPYVLYVIEELVNVANTYTALGIKTVAISSNDVENYPVDNPEMMTGFAQQYAFTFPYLYDETQEIAKAYDAACTPDLYLFDADGKLYYRGRLDGSRPNNEQPIDGAELRNAIDEMLTGAPAPEKQYPSVGCNIKWK